jgi:Fe-S-cluster containining protein
VRVGEQQRACERFEARAALDCVACGACCREGYDRVEVRPRELVKKRHPELLSRDRYGDYLARPNGRCVALEGSGEGAPYRCRIYDARPRGCSELEVGGDACLFARRRVGLSA